MAKKQLIDAYFRFLNLAQAVQALPSVPKLNADRRLARLKEQGLVTLDEAQTDRSRTKTVVPTQKALAYFEQLAACLEKAKKKK